MLLATIGRDEAWVKQQLELERQYYLRIKAQEPEPQSVLAQYWLLIDNFIRAE